MIVYFVRHGESVGNAAQIHQDAETPLSQKGEQQATLLGERFKTIAIDYVVTSHYTRAKETAKRIAEATKTELIVHKHIHEKKNPSEVEGLAYTAKAARVIKKKIRQHTDDKNWHYSDEENFYEFKNRTRDALHSLVDYHPNNIAVVSHGHTLRAFLAHIVLQNDFSESFFHETWYPSIALSNTAITVCEYTNRWRLISWNDFAHLGDV